MTSSLVSILRDARADDVPLPDVGARMAAEALPSRRGRPRNFALDPYGLKRDLTRLGITLTQIADRAGLGGTAHGRRCYVCNVLSGRQHSPRVVWAVRALIAERERKAAEQGQER